MKLHCEELIEKLKEEIPKYDKVIQGITHLQIKLKDGGMKQIGNFLSLFVLQIVHGFILVLVLERKQVIEPQTLLKKNQIYADVYVEIHDQVLAGKNSGNVLRKTM